MNEWLLKVELNGEWEECRFLSRKEALSAFAALAGDYSSRLQRAILFAPALLFRHFDDLKGSSAASGRPN